MQEIRIVESYRDYHPPFDAAKVVRRLLKTVPEKYLRGLDCVVLTNAGSLSRRDRVGKVTSRKRRFAKTHILARYHPAWHDRRAWIEMRVDKIVASTERNVLWVPFMRGVVMGHVFFHELGHHIHRTIRPQHDEKEDVADTWAGKLNRNFVRKRYWYALPLLLPALKIYRYARRRQWI